MGAAHGRGGGPRAGFQPPRAGSRQRYPSLSKEGSFHGASLIYVALYRSVIASHWPLRARLTERSHCCGVSRMKFSLERLANHVHELWGSS
jgi:hypothetical protein